MLGRHFLVILVINGIDDTFGVMADKNSTLEQDTPIDITDIRTAMNTTEEDTLGDMIMITELHNKSDLAYHISRPDEEDTTDTITEEMWDTPIDIIDAGTDKNRTEEDALGNMGMFSELTTKSNPAHPISRTDEEDMLYMNITEKETLADMVKISELNTESDLAYPNSGTDQGDAMDDMLMVTEIYNELVHPILDNSSLIHVVNITKHRGILHGFSESITVILVSEIGDKTFFIAAILAMRNNKLTVFLAAVSALFLMTVLSGLLGWVVTTFIPREITYYTCTAIMFAFSLKMFYEAWKMDEDELQETQKEVEHELDQMDLETHRGQTVLNVSNGTSAPPPPQRGTNGTITSIDAESPAVLGKDNLSLEWEGQTGSEPNNVAGEVKVGEVKVGEVKPDKVGKSSGKGPAWMDGVIDRSCKENSWFGKKCLKIFKLFVNTFTLTFIAEWGDRSQLATIVLAGINDVVGVILGGCLGHAICTGGAVLAGAIIARYVSIRKITILGALVFLGFAIASIFIDPNEDSIDGIPEIQGYSNTSRLVNHNISLTLQLEKEEDLIMSDY